MDAVLAWIGSFVWWDVVKDAAIPVAAILIPSVIAIRLARNERLGAERARYLEARRAAAENVILALAHFVSIDPTTEDLREKLRELRGRIAVYGTVLNGADVLCGDWLRLKHREGMKTWLDVQSRIAFRRGVGPVSVDETIKLLEPGHTWANDTMETFAGWLNGSVTDETLAREGEPFLTDAERRQAVSRSATSPDESS